jgi:hypothetical protein
VLTVLEALDPLKPLEIGIEGDMDRVFSVHLDGYGRGVILVVNTDLGQ